MTRALPRANRTNRPYLLLTVAVLLVLGTACSAAATRASIRSHEEPPPAPSAEQVDARIDAHGQPAVDLVASIAARCAGFASDYQLRTLVEEGLGADGSVTVAGSADGELMIRWEQGQASRWRYVWVVRPVPCAIVVHVGFRGAGVDEIHAVPSTADPELVGRLLDAALVTTLEPGSALEAALAASDHEIDASAAGPAPHVAIGPALAAAGAWLPGNPGRIAPTYLRITPSDVLARERAWRAESGEPMRTVATETTEVWMLPLAERAIVGVRDIRGDRHRWIGIGVWASFRWEPLGDELFVALGPAANPRPRLLLDARAGTCTPSPHRMARLSS